MNDKVKPSLPNGMVLVDKGNQSRQILVGILDGKRMPAFGFDVRGTAPHHYRKVDFGNFGVIIGAKKPVEVRILLDGKQLLQKVLAPGTPPTAPGMDADLRKRMLNAPTPHYLTVDEDDNPLTFSAPDMSIEEYIAQQIHSGVMASPPTLEDVDTNGPVEPNLVLDIDPSTLFAQIDAPDPDSDTSVSDHIKAETARLANEANEEAVAEDAITAEDGEVALPDADGEQDLKQAAEEPADESLSVTQARSWAPSHGLVAVGVRLIQQVEEGEMIPNAPDGFVYTQFQLNPWDVHNKVHAKVMGRVIVPSTSDLKQMTIDEGFEDELGGGREQVSCGLKHCNHHHH